MPPVSARASNWLWMALSLTWAVSPVIGQTDRRPSLQQLVNSSDLIVVGACQVEAVDSSGNVPYVSGAITVEEVLWGDMLSFLIGEVVGEKEVNVGWRAISGSHDPVDWATHAGRKGIWLLVKTDTDVYRADGPRYLARWNRFRVVRSLRKNMVFLRHTPLSPSSKMMVDLVVRNARRQDAVVPDFLFKDGVLHLHPGVSLTLFQSTPGRKEKGGGLVPLQGRMLSLDEAAWIVVGSGEEHLVRFDLAELFDLNRRTGYTARFRIEGFGESTLVLPAAGRPSARPR